MSAPDANGWFRCDEVPPPDGRVMYYYPRLSKKPHEQAFVAIESSFIPPSQWWKPTHWQPEPAGPVK